MSGTGAEAPTTSSTPPALLVASTLSWLLGILAFGSGLTIGIPFDSVPGGGVTLAILALATGSAFCYAGYGLRKRQRSAGLAAFAAAIALIGFRLLTTGSIGPIELVAAVVMVLVGASWKHLGGRERQLALIPRMQTAVTSLRAFLKRAKLRPGRAGAPADARPVRSARMNPERSGMNQRQLASVLFAAVGVFIVLSYLQNILEYVGLLISSALIADPDPSLASARLSLSVSLIAVVLAVLCGSVLVLLRHRVADLLFPPSPESVNSSEVQAIALSVLGCYFTVQGLSTLAQAGRLDWGNSTQLVLGIVLFFGASGLARLWSFARSPGHQVDVGGGAA